MTVIRYVIYGILGLAFLALAANAMVDFCFYLKDRYCRFHIGRWKSREGWQNAVENRAVKWLNRTPTVKITDNSRYMLLDFLTGKYRSKTIQSWQKAALILGLLNSGNPDSVEKARRAAEQLLTPNGHWKTPPVSVDGGMLSYAVWKAIGERRDVRPAMEETMAVIRKNLSGEGLLSYTGGKDNPELYVDTLGLACPFLALYGSKTAQAEPEELAFRQLEFFHTYGLYENTYLPNHAIHRETKLPLGVYGWGRGAAWYLIGLMDTYENLQSPQRRAAVRGWMEEAAENYLRFQRPDGGFGATLQRMETYDSSATAVLAWFYGEMYQMTSKADYLRVKEGCLNKLLKNTRITGAIDWCQGDTKGIGIFAQTYDIMPFAQGMTLRACCMNHEK